MGWSETRGSAVATAARRTAHSDDAKQRVDEASHSVSPRFPKWLPLVVAGALVVLVGAGATAAFVGSGDDPGSSRAPATPGDKSAGPKSDEPTDDEGLAVHGTTGLPLEPTTEEVAYRAYIRCVTPSAFQIGGRCGPGQITSLSCPGGTCTLGMELTPLVGAQAVSARGASAASFTFQAGQDSVSLSGRVPHGAKQCAPQPVTAAGNRGADGSYQLRFVMEYHLGNGGGGCSSSPGTWSVELRPPA